MLPELLAAAAATTAAADLPPQPCTGCAPSVAVQGPPAPPSSLPPAPADEGRGRWFAASAIGWSWLSRGTSGVWQRREAALGWRDRRGAVSLGGEWQQRRGRSDTTLELRGERAWDGASAWLALRATPHSAFSERAGLRAGGELSLASVVALSADARLANYRTGTSAALSAGPRLLLLDKRLAVRLRGIAHWDEDGRNRFGWAGDVGFEPSDRVRLAAGAARYPETDAGITRRTRALFATAAWRPVEALTLRAGFEREARTASYRRDSLNLGIGFDF